MQFMMGKGKYVDCVYDIDVDSSMSQTTVHNIYSTVQLEKLVQSPHRTYSRDSNKLTVTSQQLTINLSDEHIYVGLILLKIVVETCYKPCDIEDKHRTFKIKI